MFYIHVFRMISNESAIRSDLRFSGIVCSVDWLFRTDVSGQPIGPVFLTFEDRTSRFYRNVGTE